MYKETIEQCKSYFKHYRKEQRWEGPSIEEFIVGWLLKPICSIYGFGVVMQTAKRLFEEEGKRKPRIGLTEKRPANRARTAPAK